MNHRRIACVACLAVTVLIGGGGARAAGWQDVTEKLGERDWRGHGLWLVACSPVDGRVIAAFHKFGVWSSTDAGATWQLTGFPRAGIAVQFVFDPKNANRFWGSGMYGFGMWRTDDGGKRCTQLGGLTHLDGMSVDFSDPARKTILVGLHEAARSIHRSRDGGATWRKIGDALPANTNHSTHPIILDPNTYLANCSGWLKGKEWGVFRSTDAGASWTKVSKFGAGGNPVITADGTIYWQYLWEGRLIRGTDVGASWTGLPGPGRGGVADLGNGRIATVGGTKLFASTDRGGTWAPFGPSLPFKPKGLSYSRAHRCFFIWRESKGRIPMAVMRYDLPENDDEAFVEVAAGTLIVWDGEGFVGGSGWMNNGQLKAQRREAKQGTSALRFHMKGGKSAGGWNWHNWSLHGLTDISGFDRLTFWAKLTGAKPTALDVCLNCGPSKVSTAIVPLQRYATGLGDGTWKKVSIPLSDLHPAPGFNPRTTYELRVAATLPEGTQADLFIDELAFVKGDGK